MAAQQSPDLPNLLIISQALDTLKAEVAKTANLPAEGATMITRPDRLMTQIEQRFEQVHQHLTAVDASIQVLTARLNATQHNINAQFANYTAYNDTSLLVSLHHYITNEDIPSFPATTGDIDLLDSQTADIIIEALGGSTEGTLEKRKLRLCRLVGVVPLPSD